MITDFQEIFDRVRDSYNVRIPTYVHVSRKNLKAVNLNIYRNLHHHHLNTQKKNFADKVLPLLKTKPQAEQIWIHYTIYAPSNRRLDTMNVGSITDKYFSDTMVEAGKIPDDNTDHIVLSTFSFGGVSKLDGYAIATVYILNVQQKDKEPEPMKILLDQEDIHNALNDYLKTLQFPNVETATVELTIENNNIVAEVIMGKSPVKTKSRRFRKPAPDKKEEVRNASKKTADSSDEGSSSNNDSGSSDGTASDVKEGTETATSTDPKGKASGNLFGEGENLSSDSPEKTEDNSSEETAKNTKPVKKMSIFDA